MEKEFLCRDAPEIEFRSNNSSRAEEIFSNTVSSKYFAYVPSTFGIQNFCVASVAEVEVSSARSTVGYAIRKEKSKNLSNEEKSMSD